MFAAMSEQDNLQTQHFAMASTLSCRVFHMTSTEDARPLVYIHVDAATAPDARVHPVQERHLSALPSARLVTLLRVAEYWMSSAKVP